MSMLSDIETSCLGRNKSRWCARCNHIICEKFGRRELVDLLWLRNISKEGMGMLGMEYVRNLWKNINLERIYEYDKRWWVNGI